MRISDWSSDVCSSDLFTCAGNSLLVFGRQFVHTQNGDDVAQFFVALQSLLHAASHCIVLFTHDLWIELAAGDRKSTRLNSSTNAHLVCRLLLDKKKHTQKQQYHGTKERICRKKITKLKYQ